MSKKSSGAKSLKKKQSAFDIMFRVITAVLAFAVFPVTYFMNLIYWAIDSSGIYKLAGNIGDIFNSGNLLEVIKNLFAPATSSTDQVIEITDGYFCLAKLDEFKNLMNMASVFGDGNKNSFWDVISGNAQIRPLVISLAVFALVLIISLVIIIISAVANKPKVVAALSGAGAVLAMGSNLIFNSFFAKPLIDGTTSLASVFGVENSMGGIVLSLIGTVVELHYDTAFFAVMFIMIAICVWALSVMIVNSGDPAYKKEAELKKAKKKAKKAAKKAKKAKKAEKKAEKAVDAAKKAVKKQEKEEKKLEKQAEKNEETQKEETEN